MWLSFLSQLQADIPQRDKWGQWTRNVLNFSKLPIGADRGHTLFNNFDWRFVEGKKREAAVAAILQKWFKLAADKKKNALLSDPSICIYVLTSSPSCHSHRHVTASGECGEYCVCSVMEKSNSNWRVQRGGGEKIFLIQHQFMSSCPMADFSWQPCPLFILKLSSASNCYDKPLVNKVLSLSEQIGLLSCFADQTICPFEIQNMIIFSSASWIWSDGSNYKKQNKDKMFIHPSINYTAYTWGEGLEPTTAYIRLMCTLL